MKRIHITTENLFKRFASIVPDKENLSMAIMAKREVVKNDTWQSKNFLDIDDDMEFEFLDIK